MANVLTPLIPGIYQALNLVSREITGYTAAVARNAAAARAAMNQPIIVPIAPPATIIDNTPGVTSPDAGDGTADSTTIMITKSRSALVRWNGEEQLAMENAGNYDGYVEQQFAEAFRGIINEVEADLFACAYKAASRAYGTAGTTPFGVSGDLSDSAGLRRILTDNGAPQTDLHVVLGGAEVMNLRGKQGIMIKANENGDDGEFRRTGAISTERLSGFWLHESIAVQPVTKGTGSGYVTSGTTAKGVKDVALVTGTGTVLPGDIVTFAADSANKYVVNKGVSAPGTITIGDPGARTPVPSGNALAVGNTYTPNVGFHRSAIQLVTRMPKHPTDASGKPTDQAIAVRPVTDPVTGITFEIAVYPQYRQVQYQVGLAWGCAAIKPRHIATLIG